MKTGTEILMEISLAELDARSRAALDKIVAEAVASEREACAKIVEEIQSADYFFVADAIRNRPTSTADA